MGLFIPCSNRPRTARELPQNPFKFFGVYTVVYQGKNSTQAVLWAHIALDYRCTSAQHTFHLSIGNRHPDIPANLFLCFVDSSDHAELQTAAGRGIGDAVFQRVLQGVGFMAVNSDTG